jgi:hypothetical protein
MCNYQGRLSTILEEKEGENVIVYIRFALSSEAVKTKFGSK